METIDKFDGEYAFLSNFYPIRNTTLEHLYQASKARIPETKVFIMEARTPGDAKRLGRVVALVDNWEEHKLEVMLTLLRDKFSIPELKEKLLATGNAILIEGNNWNDTYWGVCNGIGENHLGKLLMQVREELRK
jgi:ribA/ribD-fused uncharacterized protein